MADNRKRILVTGAAGLIGREVYLYLKNAGHDVVGVDNFSRFPDYDCDVLDYEVEEFIQRYQNDFDYIYHFAAINGTTNFYKRPLDVITNNTNTDFAIFKFAQTNDKCKLIYASTSEVVAGTDKIPTPEEQNISITDIHNPRWSYRLSKVLSENYLANSNLNYVVIRFFNLFSEHSGPGHFTYDIKNKIKNKNFEIIGAEETRSFCYVKDAVPAIVYVGENCRSDIINIGSDEEISILEAANILANRLGETPQWHFKQGLTGSVKRRCPDLTKLKTLMPEYSPRSFKEIIECMDI